MIGREYPTRGEKSWPDADIRAMRADDIGSLRTIRAICLRECLASHYTQQHIAAWLAAEGAEARGQTDEQVLVAEMQGAIAGYAAWRDGELLATFIVPPAQEMGLGTLLVERCLRDATDRGAPIASVLATLNATGFYHRLGFRTAEPGFHEKSGIRIPYQRMQRPIR